MITNPQLAVVVVDFLLVSKMIKTLFRILTPFIAIIADAINGVLLYRKYELHLIVEERFYPTFDHSTGSSVLLIGYVLSTSTHMCIYYKISCCAIIAMHVFSIIYTWTPIKIIEYIYFVWVILGFAFVMWVISILGYKTYKTIGQACKHSETE